MSMDTAAKLDLNAPLISMRRRQAAPVLQILSCSDSKVGEILYSDFHKDDEASYRKISHDLVAVREKSLVQEKADAYEGSLFNHPSMPASDRATPFSDDPENDEIRYGQRKSRQISLEDKERVHNPLLLDTFTGAGNPKHFSSTLTAQKSSQNFSHFEEISVTKSLELRIEEEWDALSDQVEHASAHNEALTPASNGTLISGSDGFSPSRSNDHPLARDFIMNRFIPAAMAIAGQSCPCTASPVDVLVHNDHHRVQSMVPILTPCSDLCGAAKEDQQTRVLDAGTIMHLQAPSRSTKFKSMGDCGHLQLWSSTVKYASSNITNPEDVEHWGSQETSNQHEPEKPNDLQGMDAASRFDSIGMNNLLSETTDVKSMSVSEGGSSRTSFTNKYRNEEALSCKGKGFLGLPNRERAFNDGSHPGPYGTERLRYSKQFENKKNLGFLLPSPGTVLHEEPDSNVKLQEPSSLSDHDKIRKASSYYNPQDKAEISLDQAQNYRDAFRKKSEQGPSSYGGESDKQRHDPSDHEERTESLASEVKYRTQYAAMPSLRAISTSSSFPADLSNKSFLQKNIVKEEPRTSLPHVQDLPPPSSPAKSWLKKVVQSSAPTPTPFAPPKEFSPSHTKKEVLPAERSRWEEVVKSRNLRPDHLRYSEERLDFENPSN